MVTFPVKLRFQLRREMPDSDPSYAGLTRVSILKPSFRGASKASEPGIQNSAWCWIPGLRHPSRLLPTWTMILLNSGKPEFSGHIPE